MQVLVVSDITSRVLFDNAVELSFSKVLDLPLSISPPLLCHHGFLECQVAARDLVEGDNGRKLLFKFQYCMVFNYILQLDNNYNLYCTFSVNHHLCSAVPDCEVFHSDGQYLWVRTHQSAQQFTAKGCVAAVFHGKRHLVDELLQPIHTLQGLTGYLTKTGKQHTLQY